MTKRIWEQVIFNIFLITTTLPQAILFSDYFDDAEVRFFNLDIAIFFRYINIKLEEMALFQSQYETYPRLLDLFWTCILYSLIPRVPNRQEFGYRNLQNGCVDNDCNQLIEIEQSLQFSLVLHVLRH